MTFDEEFPELKSKVFDADDVPSGHHLDVVAVTEVKNGCLSKQKAKDVIEKHFVCGFKQGLVGPVHDDRNCRKCNVLKDLGLDDD